MKTAMTTLKQGVPGYSLSALVPFSKKKQMTMELETYEIDPLELDD